LYDPAEWVDVDRRLRAFEASRLKLEYSDEVGRVYSIANATVQAPIAEGAASVRRP
jgi:hypothetical protein